jgi:hypothetical protein
VAPSRKHSNKPLGFINGTTFPNNVSYYQLLKKDSIAWSFLRLNCFILNCVGFLYWRSENWRNNFVSILAKRMKGNGGLRASVFDRNAWVCFVEMLLLGGGVIKCLPPPSELQYCRRDLFYPLQLREFILALRRARKRKSVFSCWQLKSSC